MFNNYSTTELLDFISNWRSKNERVVFTNGVFDILHIGHVTYLHKAKALGDRLIVGINADASVKRLGKGDDRPINDEVSRAGIIGALESVDATVIFDEDTPLELIRLIQPDVLVKGGDYDPNELNEDSKTYIVGSKEVRDFGGEVSVINFVDGFSTTSTIRKIRS